ncbi:hypothetical protein C4K22_1551 [Pseudomonas chlororaphis subsp. aurantiaca]|uniref:DUF6384 family protein n=1 Tax=Pseudomonas chlororaphis TaxID=587753 RepID=UPI000F55C776|nr:DUF6384 family protein [Pseudomonas chlororaphis]AZD34309.1 hypothetical protein C4K22_1551 [Pseudomonas chlororaphis subsp. aurantiaca]AZD40644.1 hypothetical protein C4K21_1555 [Pseudomonas chlororaphis subsp. aurantiaca]
MSQVSLTEQMGAMALIDELRHSQAETQKHLDLPRHRQAVAERIREFYRSRGIEVEDALVEEGVRNFFAARFTYQPPPLGFWSRLLAEFYISRSKWLGPASIAFVLSGVVIFGFSFSSSFLGGMKTSLVQGKVDRAQALAQSEAVQLGQLQNRLSALEADMFAANVPAAERMFELARERLDRVRGLMRITLPSKVSAESRKNDLALVDQANKNLQQGTADLQAVEACLNDLSQLLAAEAKLRELLASAPYTSLSSTFPELKAQAADARSALDHADTQGVPAARTAVDKLGALIPRINMISPYLTRLQDAQNGVRKMGLSTEDLAQFQPLLAAVNEAVLGLNTAAAEHGLQEVERLRTVAATPLTLEVVSRTGEKSMIERNYDPTGGKTWYLLTEASDASGNVVPVPITSIESGERRYASIFGVRVSQATYQAAKNDKLLDGHVDDRLMGKKAANSLTFTFVKGPVKTKPDYILEW